MGTTREVEIMIEWKRIELENLPKQNEMYLFYFDGYAYSGWQLDELDDDGYPLWEANEQGSFYGVRHYADFNYPPGE
jgi:hypothetical protein